MRRTVLFMTDSKTAKVYLTAAEVAQRYGVSLRTVQHWRKTGQLPFVALPGSRQFRFDLAEVESKIAELTAAAQRAG